MEQLSNFAELDMIEQITLLDSLREENQLDAIPALMKLYETVLADLAVDEMVYHTLFSLLAGRDEAVVNGLSSPSDRVRMLCVRQAGDSKCAAAKDVLAELAATTTDAEMVAEILRALGKFQDPALKVVFQSYLDNDNITVVSLAMRGLVVIGGDDVRDILIAQIKRTQDAIVATGICDLSTVMALENLANFPDSTVISFLIGSIHHPTPTFRRVVISVLIALGEVALPFLDDCLEKGNRDEKIMAANIIGLMGLKKGADLLMAYLDQNSNVEPNLLFAIYEALGRIPSIRSVIALKDGLEEKDELTLMAVVTGLDRQANPGIVQILEDIFDRRDDQGKAIAATVVTARATRLFKALYQQERHAAMLIDCIKRSNDQDVITVFRKELESMSGARPAADIAGLAGQPQVQSGGRRVLAADDSKAMIFFYKGVAADMHIELFTAVDGKEALECMQYDSKFDLLITDMNMPNMDGIELAREVRKMKEFQDLPILMATTESEKSQQDIAREAGVSEFISKPFTKEEFKARIAALFSD